MFELQPTKPVVPVPQEWTPELLALFGKAYGGKPEGEETEEDDDELVAF